MGLSRVVSVAAAAAALALAAGAAGAGPKPPAPRAVHTQGWIAAIALDGASAAYDVSGRGGRCNRAYLWNLATGVSTRISGARTCGADSTSTGGGVVELAVAGRRAAWIVNQGGNTESNDMLVTAALPNPKEVVLARARRTGEAEEQLTGRWLGGLVSDGTRLTYNDWTTLAEGTIASGGLWRVSRTTSVSLSGRDSSVVVARSADAGHVAVLRADGTIAVHGINGALLSTITPTSARAVALSGDRLAVLTRMSTVEVYDRTSGALLHTWPITPGAASLLDAHRGVAAYVVWRTLHALNLETGRDAVVATQKRAIVGARIDVPGVLYAYNTVSGIRDVGNVVLVPFAAVARRVGAAG